MKTINVPKTKLVKMYVWDLDFLTPAKNKELKKHIWKTPETIMYELVASWLRESDEIYISESPALNSFAPLMWIQALVNSWYKSVYPTNYKYNFWIKKS